MAIQFGGPSQCASTCDKLHGLAAVGHERCWLRQFLSICDESMAQVELENVSKVFPDGTRAVDGFSLDIAQGEMIVLVGPSGCGKSTTLRMVAGLEEISGGEIRIGGRLVNDLPPKNRDVAMVFQNYALYPHMTVYDNLAFALKLRKVPKPQLRQRVDDAAKMLGIEELAHRKPASLSGGQQQRVALGRAIVREPACFLFDEPLSNLDAKMRVEMRAEIKRLHRRLHATSIYVTHDQEEAMTLGDRLVVMHDGRIQQCGPPIEVFQKPANRFVAGFMGLPSMNFVDGGLVEKNGRLWFEDGAFRHKLPESLGQRLAEHTGQQVTLGVRPAALSLRDGVEGDSAIRATVDAVESIGERQNVYLTTAGGANLTASVTAADKIAVGDNTTIELDAEQLHFFERHGERQSLT